LGREGSFSKTTMEMEPEAMAREATTIIETIRSLETGKLEREKRHTWKAQGYLNLNGSHNSSLIRDKLICKNRNGHRRGKCS